MMTKFLILLAMLPFCAVALMAMYYVMHHGEFSVHHSDDSMSGLGGASGGSDSGNAGGGSGT